MRHLLRQFGYLALAGLAGVYVYSALRGPQGIPALREKWNGVRQLEDENQSLRRQIEEKKARIKDLKFNTDVQGTEVQKRSGKQRPENRTYILPGGRKADQKTSSSYNPLEGQR
jgi:cell division protein FtsB